MSEGNEDYNDGINHVDHNNRQFFSLHHVPDTVLYLVPHFVFQKTPWGIYYDFIDEEIET
jgi:hypothetical protein